MGEDDTHGNCRPRRLLYGEADLVEGLEQAEAGPPHGSYQCVGVGAVAVIAIQRDTAWLRRK